MQEVDEREESKSKHLFIDAEEQKPAFCFVFFQLTLISSANSIQLNPSDLTMNMATEVVQSQQKREQNLI